MTASLPCYDVAIIGAGVNGAGIARDAALRGLRVIILDKNDMCSGTSAVSSRLIHGGLRYLEYGEIPLVYESLHERRCLRRIAAHLVKPIRINIPLRGKRELSSESNRSRANSPPVSKSIFGSVGSPTFTRASPPPL